LQVGQVRCGDEPPGGLLHPGPARHRRPRLRVRSGTRPTQNSLAGGGDLLAFY
jgi:hypothetical protein